jgi:hypothetical protein
MEWKDKGMTRKEKRRQDRSLDEVLKYVIKKTKKRMTEQEGVAKTFLLKEPILSIILLFNLTVFFFLC